MKISGLQGELFRGIGNPHRSPAVIRAIAVACRTHGGRSSGGVQHRSRARLIGGRVIADTRVDRSAVRQLENEILVGPAGVSPVILKELIVADAGAGKKFEIE